MWAHRNYMEKKKKRFSVSAALEDVAVLSARQDALQKFEIVDVTKSVHTNLMCDSQRSPRWLYIFNPKRIAGGGS